MNNNLANNLKKIRKDNNLSQEQLAEKLNVSRQAISKWESNQAYPEMDKIMQICKLYNVNIDDLMHNDIAEIKSEESAKKTINGYLDEFLSFITNSVDMLSSMKFKNRIKCLIEQVFIVLLLYAFFFIIGDILENIFIKFISMINAYKVGDIILSILSAIYYLASIILIIIITVHLYKKRYLSYYLENNIQGKEETQKKEKINNEAIIPKKEEKIIIRDQKDSESHLLRFFYRLFILCIKCFLITSGISVCILLMINVYFLIVSIIFIKNLLFEIGLALCFLGIITVLIDIILLILNFIFNRKQNKRFVIYSFISSLIIAGIGAGICTYSLSSYSIIYNVQDNLVLRETYLDMKDNLYIDYFININYIEEKRDDIKVEYKSPDYVKYYAYSISTGEIYLESDTDYIKSMKYFIDNFNDKKIILDYDNFVNTINVYTSKTNIDKLKKNREIAEKNSIQQNINEYESRINILENELNNCREKTLLFEED